MTAQDNTPIAMAPAADAGPIGSVPRVVGICTAHGWWFEARSQQDTCPQGGCYAPVHFFVWRNEHKPEEPW